MRSYATPFLELLAYNGGKTLNDVAFLEKENLALWNGYVLLADLPANVLKQSQQQEEDSMLSAQEISIHKSLARAEALKEGREAGVAIGKVLAAEKMAQELLLEGIPIERIAKIPAFSIERIMELKQQILQ